MSLSKKGWDWFRAMGWQSHYWRELWSSEKKRSRAVSANAFWGVAEVSVFVGKEEEGDRPQSISGGNRGGEIIKIIGFTN